MPFLHQVALSALRAASETRPSRLNPSVIDKMLSVYRSFDLDRDLQPATLSTASSVIGSLVGTVEALVKGLESPEDSEKRKVCFALQEQR